MRASVFLLPVLLAACGLTFDDTIRATDAGVDASAEHDATTVVDAATDSATPIDSAVPIDASKDSGEIVDSGVVDSGSDAGSNCANGVKDGNETGIDCGGGCGACLGGMCATAADCAHDAICTATSTCQNPKTCAELHAARPTRVSGAYLLDVDGADAIAARTYVCDMDFDNGGWTLILASNAQTTNTLTEGTVTAALPSYAPVAEARALATASKQVHIRTAGRPQDGITSLVDGLAIKNLRAGDSPGKGMKNVTATTNWSGTFATDGRLKYTCDPGSTVYPNIFWGCGLSNGLHLCEAGSSWRLNAEAATALETWVR